MRVGYREHRRAAKQQAANPADQQFTDLSLSQQILIYNEFLHMHTPREYKYLDVIRWYSLPPLPG